MKWHEEGEEGVVAYSERNGILKQACQGLAAFEWGLETGCQNETENWFLPSGMNLLGAFSELERVST